MEQPIEWTMRGTKAVLEMGILHISYKTLILCKFMTYYKHYMTYYQVSPHSWTRAIDHMNAIISTYFTILHCSPMSGKTNAHFKNKTPQLKVKSSSACGSDF